MRSALLCAIIFICGIATPVYAGQSELTAAFPAPVGNYPRLNSTGASNFATAGGNVGIGTTNPQATLQVISQNTNWPGVRIYGNANGGVLQAIQDDGTSRNLIFQDTGGRVGINMAAPTQMLHVNGNIAARSTATGWTLGKNTGAVDSWLKLTQISNPAAWQDFACGALEAHGTLWANGAMRFDLAEMTPVKDEDALELGDVVVMDKEMGSRVTRSSKPYDTAVYGIVSSLEQAAMLIGEDVDPGRNKSKEKLPIALIGRIKAKVSAENGAIAAGDLLTTSSTPGHLMKCEDKEKCVGAIAGKALEPFESGQGAITVLATLQ